MCSDFTETGNVILTASVLGLECYFPLFLALLPRPTPSAALVPGRPPTQCPSTLPAPSSLGPAATCGNAGHTGGRGTATTARVTRIILHTLPVAPPPASRPPAQPHPSPSNIHSLFHRKNKSAPLSHCPPDGVSLPPFMSLPGCHVSLRAFVSICVKGSQ